MNNCNCKVAGSVAPSSPFNTATNCGQCPKGLTTVNIPASKGTDLPGQPLAPVMGAYENAVVTYAATGSVYLYDEDGVYTNLTGDKVLPVLAELQEQMAQLTTEVSANTSGLETEKADRVSGQATLQAAIDALQAALTAETAARTEADTELTSQIETLQGQATDSAQGLTAETEARTEAVTNLQSQIDALQAGKQDTLNSGTNIKTVNGQSLLGEGNIDIESGGSGVNIVQTTGTSTTDVMSQKAVTDALAGETGVTGATLSSSATDNQITLTTTVAGEPDYSRVDVKTINGESLLGEGDIVAATKIRERIPNSPVSWRTGALKVEMATYNVGWAQAQWGTSIAVNFSPAFVGTPVVFVSAQIPTSAAAVLTTVPDIKCIVVGTTPNSTSFMYQIIAPPTNIPEGTQITFNIVAIGLGSLDS